MSIILNIKVKPNSRCIKFYTDTRESLVACIKSSPEKGKANKELIKVLAKALEIAQSDIEIISGAISRYKRIKISTILTMEELFYKLGIDAQQLIFKKE